MPQDEKVVSLDGQLELKKRARRRLVGAAALALLAAVILPMVMDHEPRQPAQDVQITIPSREDQGLAARVLTGKPAATPLPPATATRPAAKSDDAKPAEAGTAEAKSAARPEPVSEPKAEPKAEERTSAKPADKPPGKPADKPAPDKAEEARALAALAGAAAPDESWVVQLGAYKEEGRIKLLLSKIKQLGLPVFTENVDTPQGARTRVRAGPFKTREAADKARERIGRIGVDGPVARK